MAITTSWVRYGDGDQHLGFSAVSERAQTPLPAVVVIQEAWGVDAHIQDVTRRLAEAGYFAFAPDLYAAGGVRPAALRADRIAPLLEWLNVSRVAVMDAAARAAALVTVDEPLRSQLEETASVIAAGLGQGFDRHVPQLSDSVRFLREQNAATKGQPVASVGYCMGGACSALLACHEPALAGACIYYGPSPSADKVAGIGCPVLGFYGSLDTRIVGGLPAFEGAMSAAGKRFEKHVYEGVEHAFFNDQRPSYHAAASRDAFARTLAFFRDVLGGAREV